MHSMERLGSRRSSDRRSETIARPSKDSAITLRAVRLLRHQRFAALVDADSDYSEVRIGVEILVVLFHGISLRHAPHQVAQKFNSTTFPRRAVRETRLPSSAANSKFGAIRPASIPLRAINQARATLPPSSFEPIVSALEILEGGGTTAPATTLGVVAGRVTVFVWIV